MIQEEDFFKKRQLVVMKNKTNYTCLFLGGTEKELASSFGVGMWMELCSTKKEYSNHWKIINALKNEIIF